MALACWRWAAVSGSELLACVRSHHCPVRVAQQREARATRREVPATATAPLFCAWVCGLRQPQAATGLVAGGASYAACDFATTSTHPLTPRLISLALLLFTPALLLLSVAPSPRCFALRSHLSLLRLAPPALAVRALQTDRRVAPALRQRNHNPNSITLIADSTRQHDRLREDEERRA